MGGPTPLPDCEVNCETDPDYGNLPYTIAGEPILRFPQQFPITYNPIPFWNREKHIFVLILIINPLRRN